jgi:hypothetical protein
MEKLTDVCWSKVAAQAFRARINQKAPLAVPRTKLRGELRKALQQLSVMLEECVAAIED